MKELYVISGGPCSGKTTLVNYLKNKGFYVVDEAARLVVERGLFRKEDFINIEKRFELQKVISNIQIELENKVPDNTVAFLDRSLIDGVAYLWIVNLEPDVNFIEECKKRNYKAVFILEQLENYTVDDVRYESYDMAKEIHKLIIKAYEFFGYQPFLIKRDSVEKRAEEVIKIVKRISNILLKNH
ncbi:MAG: ATP-binding protein [Thermoproteota archaeon]